MNTQTQTTSKGQLALVLVGILLIPLYAVYFNETPKEKIDRLKNDEIVLYWKMGQAILKK